MALVGAVSTAIGCGAATPRPHGAEALDLGDARAIYVGEEHDSEAHHRLEVRVLEQVLRQGGTVALGLEMFARDMQAPLDAYVEGEIDEETLLSRTSWNERWGMDFALYRPLLELARAHHVRVIALNAPPEWTRAVAQRGLEGLDPETRGALPELDLTDVRHREMIRGLLTEHPGMPESALDRFYAAQVVWDETMAESVSRVMSGSDAPQRIVVCAGTAHVREGLGIPARAARRGVTPFTVVLASDAASPAPDGSPAAHVIVDVGALADR